MPLILGTNSIKDTGYNVANSLRFESNDTAYLTRNEVDPTVSNTKATFSFWTKRSVLGSNQDVYNHYYSTSEDSRFFFTSGDKFRFTNNVSGASTLNFETSQVFRDVSAWYNIIIALDSTQGTESNRVKMWVNGTQVTSWTTSNYPNQNASLRLDGGAGYSDHIGRRGNGSNYFDGYLAEFVKINNTALDETSFGEFDGDSPTIWKPKDVSGLTFGTKGAYFEFKQSGTSQNSSGLGADTSGNDNHFAVNNLAATDQSIDTCTNNFCTLNPLSKGTITLAEGNLQWQGSGDNGGKGTFLMTKGKWYWEMKRGDSEDNVGFGVAISNWTNSVNAASGEAWYGYQGQAYKVSGSGEVSYGATFTNNDIVSCLFNADDGILAFYKNGASQGNAYTGLTNSDGYVPIYFTYRSSVTNYMNFGSPMHSISSGNSDANGHGNFEYAVPSGYFALCTKNLAEFG